MNITQALLKLAPAAEWVNTNDDYNQLEWHSPDIPKPTRAQVEAKIQELKAAEPMRLLRIERDRLLAETDWWAVSDRTMTSEQSAYRQALRDLPDTATPVLDSTSRLGISGVDWPVKP
jgi:Phage tail assembly chaperone protein